VSSEAEEKEDEEQVEGGHQEASVIPAQEVQSTSSRSHPAIRHSHRASRREKYLQVEQHPSSVIQKLVRRAQEPKREERTFAPCELSWMSCLSGSRMSLRGCMAPEPSHCCCRSATAALQPPLCNRRSATAAPTLADRHRCS